MPYYSTEGKVCDYLNHIDSIVAQNKVTMTETNIKEITDNYSWKHLVNQHEEYFSWLMNQQRK